MDVLPATITREVEEITTARYKIDTREDPDWGRVCVVTLDTNASETLRVWLELQKRHPGVPIVVKWTGATDVTKEELIERALETARAGGLRARAPPGFDAVHTVQKDRE